MWHNPLVTALLLAAALLLSATAVHATVGGEPTVSPAAIANAHIHGLVAPGSLTLGEGVAHRPWD